MKRSDLKVGEVYSIGTPSYEKYTGRLLEDKLYTLPARAPADARYIPSTLGKKPASYSIYSRSQFGFPVMVIPMYLGKLPEKFATYIDALASIDLSEVDITLTSNQTVGPDDLTVSVGLYEAREFRRTAAEQAILDRKDREASDARFRREEESHRADKAWQEQIRAFGGPFTDVRVRDGEVHHLKAADLLALAENGYLTMVPEYQEQP